MSPYDDWHRLAWAGALIITFAVLTLSILARVFEIPKENCELPMNADRPEAECGSSIRDLSFYYGATKALKNISMPLYDQKVTAFIGPSGCGKSTLLRIMNRIYELYPDQRAEGEVLLDGQNILTSKPGPQSPARAHRHGVPEADAVPDDDLRQYRLRHQTLRAHGEIRARRPRRECAAARSAVERGQGQAEESGLSLSGGQQQRLCIARTVATQPEVILLDEPCSALDPISTAKIEELIDELANEYTIVIVTHNMQQASRVSDYTAFMFLGELIEFGTTEQLFTAPQNKRTEEYITGRFG